VTYGTKGTDFDQSGAVGSTGRGELRSSANRTSLSVLDRCGSGINDQTHLSNIRKSSLGVHDDQGGEEGESDGELEHG
jgi:hypothetical protein